MTKSRLERPVVRLGSPSSGWSEWAPRRGVPPARPRGPSPTTPSSTEEVATFRATCTKNNTHVTLRWRDRVTGGSVQRTKSTGDVGRKGTKRGTPYAAEQVAQGLLRQAKSLGPARRPTPVVHLRLDGEGPGRAVVSKGIRASGFEILSISDVTGVPHGGCRPKAIRRV